MNAIALFVSLFLAQPIHDLGSPKYHVRAAAQAHLEQYAFWVSFLNPSDYKDVEIQERLRRISREREYFEMDTWDIASIHAISHLEPAETFMEVHRYLIELSGYEYDELHYQDELCDYKVRNATQRIYRKLRKQGVPISVIKAINTYLGGYPEYDRFFTHEG